MIFSAVFGVASYVKVKTQNTIMKVCLAINGMYGIFGVGAIALMSAQKFT